MSVRSLDFDRDAEKLFSELENNAGSHLEEAINYSVRTLRDDEAYFDPYHAIRLYEGMDSLPLDEIVRVMLTSYEQALHYSDPSVEEELPFEDDNLHLLDFYDQIGFQEFDGKYLPLKPTAVGAELLNGFIQDYRERHPYIFDN
ncbi:MAG: hypothetical protein BRC29_04245 [Nanohaloarchaea archaeon SW_7_43_1]|nr:MAG: hypothetical protein BRC29_04245 [Nanohaloarchaea archaeon SW_7_43_1]